MDLQLTPRITPAAKKSTFKPLALDGLLTELRHLPAAFELVPQLLSLLDDPDADL
jgi:hypothetical protein